LGQLDGGFISLNDLHGKIVFLHFWATWCPTCLIELPGIRTFSKQLDPDTYIFLAVCVDDRDPRDIRAFCSAAGFHMPMYLDPGRKVAMKYGTFRYPETYIIDQQGIVRKKIVGIVDWSSRELLDFLNRLLEEGKSASKR
jgi:peroxiredoxin